MQLDSYNDILKISPTIEIKKYIIDLILPKCNIVFGKTFSSVYFQILLYTNRDPHTNTWKKDKCWLGVNTIAKNINGNTRAISDILNFMKKIDLIDVTYHGRLKMYSLKNNNLQNVIDINNFNNNIENKLFLFIKKYDFKQDKINKIISKFKIFDNEFKNTVENYQFKDINLLRQWLIISEKVNHGSTLMFMMFFAKYFINLNEISIDDISEINRAKKIGCSQSTINRYFSNLKDMNYINIIKRFNLPNKIIINKEMLKMEQQSNTETFKCPICNKEVENIKKFTAHISRCKDELHVNFRDMQKKNNACTIESVNKLYELNKEYFGDIIKAKEEEKKKKENDNKKLNSLSVQLLKYYYDLTNTKCPNWGKETNLLKSHIKNGLSPDEVMEIMRYMAKRSYADLRFFGNSINDALTVRECKLNCKNEGTDPYLVKFYYDGMNQKITDRLMLQGIKKINELKANNYNYLQIKSIIEYMIDKKCPNFNFIVNMANEALTKSKDRSEMTKAYTIKELVGVTLDGMLEYGNILLSDSNYDIAKRDIILKLKQDICDGKVLLTRINKVYYDFAISLAQEIYNRKLFNSSFTSQQWVNKIELNKVNLELISN